jgi:hypothetical protein
MQDVPIAEYVLFDFSEPMMATAQEALRAHVDVSF